MGFEKDVQEQDKNLEKISEMLSDALSLLILLENDMEILQELALPSIQHGGVNINAGRFFQSEQVVSGTAVQGG